MGVLNDCFVSFASYSEFTKEVDFRFSRTLSAGCGEKQERLVQPRQANEEGTSKSLFDLLGTSSFDIEGLAISAGHGEPFCRYAPLKGLTCPLMPLESAPFTAINQIRVNYEHNL
ncbi:hypothetical protein ACFQPF_07585 [Fictibacillus iocasae]|uniref:Uncharacterized protein n=1 Tax=Fictibacillus iocasae TaxID=2715437 RepID=A0ABW2NQG8_9BACL